MDQIILSSNEDPKYLSFWPYVADAYKKMFPEAIVHLALLTWRDNNDPMIAAMREHGFVTTFQPVGGVAEFGQAKMIRFLLASQQDTQVCYIDDIDLFPLKKTFITNKLSQRPPNVLLCVGGEVYGNNGCYPVSQMTAEGHVWKKFINPNDEPYDQLIENWSKPGELDEREEITIKLDFAQDKYFSDERLIRKLRKDNPVPIKEVQRGYGNYMSATLDRAGWELNQGKLDRHKYENAHCCRPFDIDQMRPLIEYIENNY